MSLHLQHFRPVQAEKCLSLHKTEKSLKVSLFNRYPLFIHPLISSQTLPNISFQENEERCNELSTGIPHCDPLSLCQIKTMIFTLNKKDYRYIEHTIRFMCDENDTLSIMSSSSEKNRENSGLLNPTLFHNSNQGRLLMN
jgi:hypothetical protein